MKQLTIRTFGGFEATLRGAATPVVFHTRKAVAVTAYLAVQRNGQRSREELAETLWSGVPPAQSRHSLRQTLLEMRRALGTGADRVLRTTPDAARMDPTGVRIDVRLFERAIARGTPRSIALACQLYQGDFLAGLHVREPAFDHWVVNERNRLKQLAADALQQRIAFLADHDAAAALQAGLRIVELDPFHEWGHRAVMMLYARRGQFGAAQRHYQAFAGLLKEELDVDPETETRDLLRRLLKERSAPPLLRRAE